MSEARYQLVKRVYYEASDKPAAERETFLDDACNGDAALRDEVLNLLSGSAESEAFLERPAVSSEALREVAMASMAEAASNEPLPEQIGRYRIIRLLGEGGMGCVYEAEQDVPQRRVALKVLRSGMSTGRVLRRFQQEVEVLGRLQHPGIARIYDAGVADVPRADGCSHRLPFFAMEFIDGRPITHYAADHHFEVHERLELLARVCDAVHFGHQQGVIHRDLKPANILVIDDLRLTIDDSSAADRESPRAKSLIVDRQMSIPKIIDFGVARATNADIAVTTLHTDAGQILGTLAYMSPEQVRGDASAIDTRCDVYALGVLGYELLAGRLPYDVSGKVVPEAARIIRDEEPSRLSSISRVFRGDIETIFAKALEKEPVRRYASAAAMAADIRRYLNDEPLVARPPTLRYQLGKFAQRHKELVAGLALVFLVLVAGIVGTSLAMFHAQRRAHDATIQARRAMTVSKFMQDVLASATPTVDGGGREVRVADVLDDAATQLNASMGGEPEIEMQARWMLGESYLGLGLHEEALTNLTRALELANQTAGAHSRDALRISNTRAWVLLDLDRYEDARMTVEPALATALKTLGPADRCSQELLHTASCVAIAASDCQLHRAHLTLLYETIRPLDSSERAIDLQTVLLGLALSAQRYGEMAEAAYWITKALAVPTATVSNAALRQRRGTSLAAVLDSQRWPNAEQTWRDLLATNETRYGADHAEMQYALGGLLELLERNGNFAEAIALRERRRDNYLRTFPHGHIGMAMDWGNIGALSARLGLIEQATNAFGEAVAMSRRVQGDDYEITQAWWREAVIRLGMGLHDRWASEAIRSHCLRTVDDALKARRTSTFNFDEIDWASLRFVLERHQPELSADAVAQQAVSGDLARLKSQADPLPGVYRLRLHAASRGGKPMDISAWMLIAPWQVRAFKAWPCSIDDDERWQKLVATMPLGGQFQTSTLCYSNWWDTGFGPAHHDPWCALTAEADIDVASGDYHLRVNLDDGARVWLDDQIVLDDWTYRDWGWPVDRSVPIRLSQGAHHMRVEHFQGLGDARLWLRLEPAGPQ